MAHCTKWCQTAAMLTSEVSMAFNIVITIIFWGVLVPQIIHNPPAAPAAGAVCPYPDWLKF